LILTVPTFAASGQKGSAAREFVVVDLRGFFGAREADFLHRRKPAGRRAAAGFSSTPSGSVSVVCLTSASASDEAESVDSCGTLMMTFSPVGVLACFVSGCTLSVGLNGSAPHPSRWGVSFWLPPTWVFRVDRSILQIGSGFAPGVAVRERPQRFLTRRRKRQERGTDSFFFSFLEREWQLSPFFWKAPPATQSHPRAESCLGSPGTPPDRQDRAQHVGESARVLDCGHHRRSFCPCELTYRSRPGRESMRSPVARAHRVHVRG